MKFKIPFFKTTLGKEEIKAVERCIKSGWVVMGEKTQEFEEKFAKYVGAKYAVFVDSGTSALFLALKSLNIPEEELISIPSLTFVSTAEIVVNAGYEPLFVDVDLDDLCMMDWGTEYRIPVHLTGNRCNIDAQIYDSAHRIEKNDVKNSKALWCYSFYTTKNLTTVQGGMIALNNKKIYEWLRMARDHGITKGTKERYTQITPTYEIKFNGYRVKGDDLRAVIGLEQLKKLPEMNAKRNKIVKRYNKNLNLDRKGNHLYYVLVSNREKFFKQMYKAGIQCSVHFLPLHKMPAFRRYACEFLSHTEYLGKRLVSLPLYPQMTNKEVDYVSKKVLETGLLLRDYETHDYKGICFL